MPEIRYLANCGLCGEEHEVNTYIANRHYSYICLDCEQGLRTSEGPSMSMWDRYNCGMDDWAEINYA